jgi:WXG100 family type VII secretion target
MEYRVNTEAIEEISNQIQQKHQDILGTIGELRGLNDGLDAAWDGVAQQSFEASFGDWIIRLEQFSETLESVKQFLDAYILERIELDEIARQAASGSTG